MLLEANLPKKADPFHLIATPEELPLACSASPSLASSCSSSCSKRSSLLTKLLKENEIEGLSSSNVSAIPKSNSSSSSSLSREKKYKRHSSTLDYSCEDLLYAIARELSSRAEQLGTSPRSPSSLSLFGSEESTLFESGLRRFAVCDKASGAYLYNVCVDFAQQTLCLREGMSSPVHIGGLQEQRAGTSSLSFSQSPAKYARSPLQELKCSPREAIFVEVSARRVASPRGKWRVVDSVALNQGGKEDSLNSSSSFGSHDGSDCFYSVDPGGDEPVLITTFSTDSSEISRDLSRDPFELSV